jgi:hypothetical protein
MVQSACSAVLVLLLATMRALDQSVGPDGVRLSKTDALDAALASSKAAAGLRALELQLDDFCGSADLERQVAATGWLVATGDGLTGRDRIALMRRCLVKVTSAVATEGLRAGIADAMWQQLDQGERRVYYSEAISAGAADLWEGRQLPRTKAIVVAAYEGLTEFRAAIQEYGCELDDPRDLSGPRATAVLLWTVKLREGARDEADGDRREGLQIAELPDGKFADLMSTDSAFEHVVILHVARACSVGLSEECARVTQVLRRQEARLASSDGSTAKPKWIARLREVLSNDQH